jgi:hypothetical protein
VASKKFKGKLCVYCAENLSTDGEHIFAKKFFMLEQRNDLPQVPACQDCNREKNKLEMYLMAVLPFGGRHADAHCNLENVPNRLAKNIKLYRSLTQGRRTFWDKNASGIYIPKTTVPIRHGCIERLAAFWAKGLLWCHWEVYLTQEHFVEATALTASESECFERSFSNVSQDLKVSANLGDGTFVYKGFREINSPETTTWWFSISNGLTLGHSQTSQEVASHFNAFTGDRTVLDEAAWQTGL